MTKLGDEKYQYQIKKIFNNNVVLAVRENDHEEEFVLIGKGLGFAKDKGDIISADEVEIEREFIPVEQEKEKAYQQLVDTVDEEIIGLTEEIIAMVSTELDEELNSHIHIGLADHIGSVLSRINEGIEIANPFLPETKTLYSKEYQLAKKAVKMIEDRLDISIPREEIGFITLHIHGARENRGMSKTIKYTTLIGKMVRLVEEELGLELSYQSLNYARLVTHLRFALERIEQDKINENPLLDNIRSDFTDSYQLAAKLVKLIEEKLDYKVPEDEIGYLAMHLQRLEKDLA
ncbi:PRD domain-containing protein [Halanaerocella petrolearia]